MRYINIISIKYIWLVTLFLFSSLAISGEIPPPPKIEYLDSSPILIDGDLSDWINIEKYKVHSEYSGADFYMREQKRKYTNGKHVGEIIKSMYAIYIDKTNFPRNIGVNDISIVEAFARKSDGEILKTARCTKNEVRKDIIGWVISDICLSSVMVEDNRKTTIMRGNDFVYPYKEFSVNETEDSITIEFVTERSPVSITYLDASYNLREVSADEYYPITRLYINYKNITGRDYMTDKYSKEGKGNNNRVLLQCESNGSCGQTFPHTAVLSISGGTPNGDFSISVGINTNDDGHITWGTSVLPSSVTGTGVSLGLTIFKGTNNIVDVMEGQYNVFSGKIPGCPVCSAGVVTDQYGQILGATAFLSKFSTSKIVISTSTANPYGGNFIGVPEYVNINGVELILDSHQTGNDGGNYGGPGDDHNGNDDRSNSHSGGTSENSDGCKGCNTSWGGR